MTSLDMVGKMPSSELISVTHAPHALAEAAETPLYIITERTVIGTTGRYEFATNDNHPNKGARVAAFNALVELLINSEDEEAVRLRTISELTRASTEATGVAIGELRAGFTAASLAWPFRHSGWGQAARIRRDEDVMLCDARTKICAPSEPQAARAFLEASIVNPNTPHFIRSESCRRVATVAMRALVDATSHLREATVDFNKRSDRLKSAS